MKQTIFESQIKNKGLGHGMHVANSPIGHEGGTMKSTFLVATLSILTMAFLALGGCTNQKGFYSTGVDGPTSSSVPDDSAKEPQIIPPPSDNSNLVGGPNSDVPSTDTPSSNDLEQEIPIASYEFSGGHFSSGTHFYLYLLYTPDFDAGVINRVRVFQNGNLIQETDGSYNNIDLWINQGKFPGTNVVLIHHPEGVEIHPGDKIKFVMTDVRGLNFAAEVECYPAPTEAGATNCSIDKRVQ